MLNQPSGKLVADVYPAYKAFRRSNIYCGGLQNRGSAFTMLHKRGGFPENRYQNISNIYVGFKLCDNRAFKVLPSHPNFKIYFSPDVAMANELVLTNDAKVNEFKY